MEIIFNSFYQPLSRILDDLKHQVSILVSKIDDSLLVYKWVNVDLWAANYPHNAFSASDLRVYLQVQIYVTYFRKKRKKKYFHKIVDDEVSLCVKLRRKLMI